MLAPAALLRSKAVALMQKPVWHSASLAQAAPSSPDPIGFAPCVVWRRAWQTPPVQTMSGAQGSTPLELTSQRTGNCAGSTIALHATPLAMHSIEPKKNGKPFRIGGARRKT